MPQDRGVEQVGLNHLRLGRKLPERRRGNGKETREKEERPGQ
jgi:hypothetical protein